MTSPANTRRILEQVLHAALRGAAHLAVIHPELVFKRRDQNLGIGIGKRIVRYQETVHVVAVVMRDQIGTAEIL